MRYFLHIGIGCCIFALLTGLAQRVVAQDGIEVRGLEINTGLINAKKPLQRKSAGSLSLPFFDDFSSLQSPYPNVKLWQDQKVFVNANFPLFPPTTGVATFDAFDANGRLYTHAATYSFPADTLTSQPIRLDSVFSSIPHQSTAEDSIYLSFYYQPGGGFGGNWTGTQRGRAPGKNDRLILEFLNRFTRDWDEMWSVDGQTLTEFCPLCEIDTAENLKTYFKQNMILIQSDTFLFDGFQFRFRTISSIDEDRQSDAGQWHLDYVRLAANRSVNDESSLDIAFVDRAERVLKDFQAMPVKQFRGTQDLVSSIPIVFRNLDQSARTVEYQYRILNGAGQVVWDMTPTNASIYPFYSHGFNSNPDFSTPQLTYQFPNMAKHETFRIQHILKLQAGSQDAGADNDTMEQTVHFSDFYAYDDGTPELGFGFGGQNPQYGQFAYRFPLHVPDTLVAIQIWFNHTLQDMGRVYLNLAVWLAENDSTPSQQQIYTGRQFSPTYNETIGYQTYVLDEPLPLSSDILLQKKSFFIGFQQQSEGFLNIGFDQNNHAENSMFFHDRVGNQWKPIIYYGSVMMRPVFGTSIPSGLYERGIASDALKIHPNPSDGTIFVESSEMLVNSYEIYNLSGRKLQQNSCRSSQFSIRLPEHPGVYLLLLNTDKGLVSKKVVRR